MTAKRFSVAQLAEADPDLIFDELLQSIYATIHHRSITELELPEVIQTFFYPAHMVGHTNNGGYWEYLASFTENDGTFDEERLKVLLKSLKELGANKSARVFKKAVKSWKNFIADRKNFITDPGAPVSPQWKATRKTLFELECSFSIQEEIVPKATKYVLVHVNEIDDFGLISR